MKKISRWSLISLPCLAALAILIGGSEGCAGKTASDHAYAQPTSQAVSQVIGPAGGTVSTSDGAALVEIPGGALSNDVEVTITPLTSVTIPGRELLSDAFEFGPDGTTFAKSITVTLKTHAFTDALSDVKMSVGVGAVFTTIPATVSDGWHVSAQTTHFSTYVATVVGGSLSGDDAGSGPVNTVDASDASDGSIPTNGANCLVMCEGPDNIDGGIGCGCGVTCGGVHYEVQCVCGACTCYQDGVPGTTTTLSVSACNTGAMGLMTTYFNTCGYPGAKNGGGGGGPVSNDGGGTCP